jgi:hypothetical protein
MICKTNQGKSPEQFQFTPLEIPARHQTLVELLKPNPALAELLRNGALFLTGWAGEG